jgi:ribosomal-protein-alanine N-acetyltransferase
MDIQRLLTIEENSFDQPWDEKTFLDQMRKRDVIGLVSEVDGIVAGYIMYSLEDGWMRLLNLAVTPELRRQSIGSQLVMKLKSKLELHKREFIEITVREGNTVAQVFFRELGFVCELPVLRSHFEDPVEDGYQLFYRLRKKIKE